MNKTEWATEHGGIVSEIIAKICTKANLSYAAMPDTLVLHDEIFGVSVTYERKVFIDKDEIQEFCYSLYTDKWVIKMTHDSQKVLDPNDIAKLIWKGNGDYDRWSRDIILIKLGM